MSNDDLIGWLEGAKWAFVAAYVLSTIGVTIGVHWENDKFPKSKQRLGHRVLVWALIGDTLFTIFIFAVEGWVGVIQRDEIVSLNKKLAPRELSDEQIAAMAKALLPYAGQKYLGAVAPGVADGCLLWGRINKALVRAEWKQIPSAFPFCAPGAEASGLPLVGITLFSQPSRDAKTAAATDALVAALRRYHSTRSEVTLGNGNGTTYNEPDVITVEVGIKP